jgi:hypothetical protein
MGVFWIALGGLGVLSGAAFLVHWLLVWTGQDPPGVAAAISGGVMLLVTGAFRLRAAAAGRGRWVRSAIKVGRLTAFAEGTFCCAIAAAIVGSQWLPGPFVLGCVAVAAASFFLCWFGKTQDARREQADGESNQPAGQGAEPSAAADLAR